VIHNNVSTKFRDFGEDPNWLIPVLPQQRRRLQ